MAFKPNLAAKKATEEVQRKSMITSDEIIGFATEDLLDFHRALSRYSLDKREPELDLAIDKIARAITALEKWHRSRPKKGQ
jgi:hypothetical protein